MMTIELRRAWRQSVRVVVFLCLTTPTIASAQSQKIPRVGFLCWVTCGDAYHEAFWQALRKLGYADYKNITFENRAAGGDVASLDTLAAELVGLGPAVIVADTTQSAKALKNATGTIPLVAVADDPIGSGLITRLGRPEGNITGLSSVAGEMGVKQLQLIKEAVPKASRVAVFGNPANPAIELRLRAMQAAARELGVALMMVEVRTPSEHEKAFSTLEQNHVDAIVDSLGGADRSNSATSGRVLELAQRQRLPTIYQSEDLVTEGGLMSYGPSLRDEFGRAATYVDKILKGAKPADLPVEQPTRFQLVINLKAAKAIGITLPTSILLRADEVIE
jgi:putative ABC transport system substrate-binding protein